MSLTDDSGSSDLFDELAQAYAERSYLLRSITDCLFLCCCMFSTSAAAATDADDSDDDDDRKFVEDWQPDPIHAEIRTLHVLHTADG